MDFSSPADVVYPKQKSTITKNANLEDITVVSWRQRATCIKGLFWSPYDAKI